MFKEKINPHEVSFGNICKIKLNGTSRNYNHIFTKNSARKVEDISKWKRYFWRKETSCSSPKTNYLYVIGQLEHQ